MSFNVAHSQCTKGSQHLADLAPCIAFFVTPKQFSKKNTVFKKFTYEFISLSLLVSFIVGDTFYGIQYANRRKQQQQQKQIIKVMERIIAFIDLLKWQNFKWRKMVAN